MVNHAEPTRQSRFKWLHLVILAVVVVMVVSMLNSAQPETENWVYDQAKTTSAAMRATPTTGANRETPLPEQTGIARRTLYPAVTPEPPGEALILAHYMTWFKTREFSDEWGHWNWDPDGDGGRDAQDHLPDRTRDDGLLDLASAHQPLIGPYDSSDPEVIEYQIASAWAAGIDGFVSDWYGPNDSQNINQAFTASIETAERWRENYGLRFFMAVTYEEQILGFTSRDAQTLEATATTHLNYILEHFTSRDCYLSYEQVPVIFYWESWPDGRPGLLQPDQLVRIRANLPEFYLLYMGAEATFLTVTEGFFSWVSGANEDPADWGSEYVNWVYGEMDYRSNENNLKLVVGGVWAGFDDSMVWGWGNTPRFIDRQDGTVYALTWDRALRDQAQRERTSPSWVQIITWNDWNEGSEIEPSLEHGTFYLTATQQYAARYTGREMPPEAILIPEAIYRARQTKPGPETEAVIEKVYQHFFARQFETALETLRAANLIE